MSKFFFNLLFLLSLFILLIDATKKRQRVHPSSNLPAEHIPPTAPPPSPEHDQQNQNQTLEQVSQHLFQNLTQGEPSSNNFISPINTPEITSPARDSSARNSSAALLNDGMSRSTAPIEDNTEIQNAITNVNNRTLANRTPEDLSTLINSALKRRNEETWEVNRPSKKRRLSRITRCLSKKMNGLKMNGFHCFGGTTHD